MDAKTNNDLIIILANNSTEKIISKLSNRNEIKKKLKILIDPSNKKGDPSHPSLRGTTITVTFIILPNHKEGNALLEIVPRPIVITISKTGGNSLKFRGFQVKKSS